MKFTRREILSIGGGAVLAAGIGLPSLSAHADAAEVDKMIKSFAGSAKVESGTVSLSTPEIAENGNTVPVSVSVESPMTKEDHVTAVMLLATGNPRPGLITFHFTPLSGEASATTRVRLAKTQDVVAVAKTSTGKVFMDKKNVKVTIGGCGG